ncbi:Aminopeptidase 2 [Anaerohalosphaera lusitana]|uniref:Aminopeptidase 2 n=1 Tax=Anaerohalosphaera lusitana TaxID=1936003 RepID=A0A1U9NI20_9BACT|nr:aminopeptidase [Anaerohalosphaera lusitana]AQT67573.1 Aminopeptidase 2 [Anaerohalosphaera lusitana]
MDINAKYADLLVNYSLKVKKGDKFLIRASYLAEDLVKEIYRAALQAGAHPELQISLDGTDRILYENASDEQLEYVSPTNKIVFESYDALLNILSPFNMKTLQSIDAEKKQKVSLARSDLMKTFFKRAAAGEFNWSLCVHPTNAAAQESGMSLDEYAEFVYSACYLNEDDPVAKWKQVNEQQQVICDRLNKATKIKYAGPDIDISFVTEGRTWINSSGNKNMPDGEVFTAPVEDSVNGKIRFSYPGFYMGQEIEDIRLEVKDGEVVDWSAAKGKDLLDKIFEIPGSRRFGEVAIGTNHGIKKFTKNMLFDEKIGGTVHMAIGATIPESGGKNESAIHWDMLADMTNGGHIYADDELVYENGHFKI